MIDRFYAADVFENRIVDVYLFDVGDKVWVAKGEMVILN
jgi:hypothetical protein